MSTLPKFQSLSKADTSRRYLSIQVDTGQPNLIDQMKAKIDTQQGKKIYARRLAIVEPVFANICVHKHMDRLTLRFKRKVDVKWTRTRFTLVHNIGFAQEGCFRQHHRKKDGALVNMLWYGLILSEWQNMQYWLKT